MPAGSAHRVAVPTLTGAAAAFGATDYSVAFTMPTTDTRNAEQWTRTTFASAPVPLRVALLFGWRHVLRLRLGPTRSPDRVLGWSVAEDQPGAFAITAGSSLVDAMNMTLVDAGSVTWITLIRHRNALGRFLWAAAAPVHQLSIPYLLKRAAKTRG